MWSPSTETAEGQLFDGMSWSTRIQGFLLFTVLGMFASMMSWVALGLGQEWKYSVLMSLGNIMSICSTALLMGPRRQFESMFDDTRRTATVSYLGLLVATMFVAFTTHSAVLCSLMCCAQYGALVWYSLSYVPYGRETLLNCFRGCGGVLLNS